MLKKPRVLCLLLFVIMFSLLLTSCNAIVDNSHKTFVWFDRHDEVFRGSDYDYGPSDKSIVLEEFPDLSFVFEEERINQYIYVVKDGVKELFIGGMPIVNAVFTDLNGDGYRELCATGSQGSGIVTRYYFVYDIHNNKKLPAVIKADNSGVVFRGNSSVELIIVDEQLFVKEVSENYPNGAIHGPLKIVDGELVIINKN